MNEEEKEAIEQLKSWREYIANHKNRVNKGNDIEFYLRIVLNLIEKQQKEINELKCTITSQSKHISQDQKEIEELKKPKYIINEKTKQIKLINDFVSKDKIREKIKTIESYAYVNASKARMRDYACDKLKELLGESNE